MPLASLLLPTHLVLGVPQDMHERGPVNHQGHRLGAQLLEGRGVVLRLVARLQQQRGGYGCVSVGCVCGGGGDIDVCVRWVERKRVQLVGGAQTSPTYGWSANESNLEKNG